MKVTFEKTNDRQYRVYVERETGSPLWTFGPGYDDELPHDLLHFVAEAEFRLDGGVFGDVAAGGHGRMFQSVDKALVAKLWRQDRMRRRRLPDGRRSEQLAGLLETAWKARRAGRAAGSDWRERARAAGVGVAQVEALLPQLDQLAAQWRALPAGGTLTIEWPRPESRKRHPPRQRRRPAKARR